MKSIKVFGITIGVLIFTFTIWILTINYAPKSWLYVNEIKMGNEFVKNLKIYQNQHNRLPDDTDWETLKYLNTVKEYNEAYPEYRKTGEDEYTLTFIQGFDSPYMTYYSKTKIWEMK